MQFTLGMPFLGVLGKFYRNRKVDILNIKYTLSKIKIIVYVNTLKIHLKYSCLKHIS